MFIDVTYHCDDLGRVASATYTNDEQIKFA